MTAVQEILKTRRDDLETLSQKSVGAANYSKMKIIRRVMVIKILIVKYLMQYPNLHCDTHDYKYHIF